jgi:hypothetical protein
LVVSAFLVVDGHVGLVGCQVLSPASLAAGEVTLGEKVLEAVVVSVEVEVLASLKVVSEDLDSVDDGQHFQLMDRVTFFSWGQLAGLVADGLRALALVL